MGRRYFDWRWAILYVAVLSVVSLFGAGFAHFAKWWGVFALGH